MLQVGHYIDFNECNGAMMGAHNVEDYAFIFERYKETMTDFQIGYALLDIANSNLIRSEKFWTVILPRVKE